MYDVINSCTSLGPGSQKTLEQKFISSVRFLTEKGQIPSEISFKETPWILIEYQKE